jgi:hypothetical protein
MRDIQKVTQDALRQVINTRQPLGLFYAKESRRLYVAVDNSTGDAWTEDFKSLRHCKRWLLDPHLTAGGDEV